MMLKDFATKMEAIPHQLKQMHGRLWNSHALERLSKH